MCTIRNTPNLIEHTIEWSRSQFEGYFCENTKNAIEFIKNTEAFMKQIRTGMTITGSVEALKSIEALIQLKKKNTFEECIAFARKQYQELFCYSIAQLLHNFPPDYKDEHGLPFWTLPKRAPILFNFNSKDPLDFLFVQSLATIIARALHIPVNPSVDYIAKVAEEKLNVPHLLLKKLQSK